MRLHAAPCISRLHLKGLHAASVAPVIFKVRTVGSMRLHASPCISRLHLKGLHAAPVVFEVYTVGSMHLYTSFKGSPCSS